MSQDDATVERVARAMMKKWRERVEHPNWPGDLMISELEDLARAALSALPERELRIGDFILRHSPNGIWIGRRGGEGGEFGTEHVERVIAQFYREQF